jgi:hypothetical protein
LDRLTKLQLTFEKRYYVEGVQKAILSFSGVIVLLSVVFILYAVIYPSLTPFGYSAWAWTFIGPAISLFSAIVGYYFGQQSVITQNDEDKPSQPGSGS